MAAEAFKVISWSPGEPITDGKLDAMVSNDNWLKTKMLRGVYGAYNKRRDEGIKLATGLVLITSRNQSTATKNVSFGGFFSDGCRPIVTTGIVSQSQTKVFDVLSGPGQDLHPNRDGFQVHVTVDDKQKIKRNFYVSWIAVGY